jgi:hypothetical protein
MLSDRIFSFLKHPISPYSDILILQFSMCFSSHHHEVKLTFNPMSVKTHNLNLRASEHCRGIICQRKNNDCQMKTDGLWQKKIRSSNKTLNLAMKAFNNWNTTIPVNTFCS